MQIPDGIIYPSKQFTEDHLKKQYLKLAKVYHPDAQGTSVKNKVMITNLGEILAASGGIFKNQGRGTGLHAFRRRFIQLILEVECLSLGLSLERARKI
jgi:hypothetical protein